MEPYASAKVKSAWQVPSFFSFGISIFFSLVVLFLCSAAPAKAQAFTATDIGGAATGTYSSGSGTYTVGGAGTGVGGSTGTSNNDSCRFAYIPVTGNVELIAKVVSQTNTSSYATAGLMLRGTTTGSSVLNSNAAGASVNVSPQNGLTFTYRHQDGIPAVTILGPPMTTPRYLRLVRSQRTIAGYASTDGVTWQLVGQFTFYVDIFHNALATGTDVGLSVASNADPTISTVVYNNVNLLTTVPQRTANMVLWLRGDAGVVYDSGTGKVSQWQDQSSYANHAVQATSGNQPTLSAGAINNLPAINFDASNSQYLTMLPSFSNFASGAQVFAVIAPVTQVATPAKILDIGNGTASDNLFMQMKTDDTAGYGTYNGSTGSEIVTGSSSIGSSFQLIEGILDNSGNGTIRLNGTSNVTGTLQNLQSLTRSNNYVGGCSAGGCYLNGKRNVSTTLRQIS